MVTTVLQIVWLVAAVGLIILVLLHSPKGDGLGALGGQAQLFTSTKSAETTLNRATWTLTILFMGATVIMSAGWLETLGTTPVTLPSEPVTPAPIEQPVQTPANAVPSDLTPGDNPSQE
jgi:preprotein translocase subunit SecG